VWGAKAASTVLESKPGQLEGAEHAGPVAGPTMYWQMPSPSWGESK